MSEDISTIVSSKYDEVTDQRGTVKSTKNSRIPHLSIFNNWIKSCLIAKFCPSQNATIFDCGCGKGGDIRKLSMKRPEHVIMADVSLGSLQENYNRYLGMNSQFQVTYIVGDCFSCNITELLPDINFHFSQCQFALHYSFRTEELARNAIRNLCLPLHPGGHVVITTTDACRIVKEFMKKPDEPFLQNNLFKTERKFDLNDIPMFGAEIIFDLAESVFSTPEYLVHPQVIKALFKEFDMELVESKTFHQFYNEAINEEFGKDKKLYAQIISKRNEFELAEMTQEEWDIIDLYKYYIFKKNGEFPELPKRSSYERKPRSRDFDLINAADGSIVHSRAADS